MKNEYFYLFTCLTYFRIKNIAAAFLFLKKQIK